MSAQQHDQSLREHVLFQLRGGGAHMSFDDFVRDFPAELCDQLIHNLPYTPWQVLEHMRIAQWDILEFSRDDNHVSPEFPTGYWPATDQLGTPLAWQRTVEKFRHDLKEMESTRFGPVCRSVCKDPTRRRADNSA